MSIAIEVAGDAACSISIKDENLEDYGRFCTSALVL